MLQGLAGALQGAAERVRRAADRADPRPTAQRQVRAAAIAASRSISTDDVRRRVAQWPRRLPPGGLREAVVTHFAEPFAASRPFSAWTTTGFGAAIHVDSADLIGRTILVSGRWEPSVGTCVQALLRPGDSFLDVGANIGYYTLLAARCVGAGGFVRAFEPSLTLWMALRANLAANGLADDIALRVAVLDKDGSVVVLEGPAANRGVTRVVGADQAAAGQAGFGSAVAAVPLDVAAAGLPPYRPLTIKMDIEGAERAASEGLERLVAAVEEVALIIEITPARLTGDGVPRAVGEDEVARAVSAGSDRGGSDTGEAQWLFDLADRQRMTIWLIPNGYSAAQRFRSRPQPPVPVEAPVRGQADYLLVRGDILLSRLGDVAGTARRRRRG